MEDIKLRKLTSADLDTVWRIHFQGNEDVALEEPLLASPPNPGARAEFVDGTRDQLKEEDHLVAERSGQVVGWAHGYTMIEPDGSLIGYVSAVYVDRGARRSGIGSALLTAVVKWLEEHKVERVQLLAAARSSARALWLKRGFRPLFETLVLERSE